MMTETYDFNDALHRALENVFAAPALPTNFRMELRNRILHERMQHLDARRHELEREHTLALEQLRQGHVRLQRDTLAMIVGVAFAAGACAHLALPWLQNLMGVDGAITLPLLAVTVGLAAGASFLPWRSH
jgi:ABC-type phosphate transport system auxiliary subunit